MASFTCSLALLLLQSSALGAAPQSDSPATTPPPRPPEVQRVTGRVVRPGPRSFVPVGNIWVTLHRVGSDRQAPMDSVRAAPDGRYTFSYHRFGDPEAIYFVSATYYGIAYFTPPLREPDVRGENAEVIVFDTTSRNVKIGVRGRHMIVSSADANQLRNVTEVYELANDSSSTLIGSNGLKGSSTWSAALPPNAQQFQVGEGDIPAAAVAVVGGRAQVYAPIAPGLRQMSFSYELPASAFPLHVPIERQTSVFEVLLEDPQGTAAGPKLREVDPVSVERRQFRRFLGAEIPANAVAVIDVPRAPMQVDRKYLVILTVLIGGAMLAALARAFVRR